jgi:hypothetical protein
MVHVQMHDEYQVLAAQVRQSRQLHTLHVLAGPMLATVVLAANVSTARHSTSCCGTAQHVLALYPVAS